MVFIITMLAQFFHVWPGLAQTVLSFFGKIGGSDQHATQNFSELINLSYRTFLTMLFFMQEISWVGINVSKKDLALMEELERNKSLKNEVSHRTKNQLNTLSAFVTRQKEKDNVKENLVAEQALSAVLSQIYCSVLVHKKLDERLGDDVNSVNFYAYFTELCNILNDLFSFSQSNFTLKVDAVSLNKQIPYAEARSIGSILTDLLTNVYQHAYDPLEPDKWVEVVAEVREDFFFMRVSDKGRGLDGKETWIGKSISSGRGLVLVSSKVERILKGAFRAKSRAGGGAEFEIVIPVDSLKIR
jgi:two-component sensor histidine kinase